MSKSGKGFVVVDGDELLQSIDSDIDEYKKFSRDEKSPYVKWAMADAQLTNVRETVRIYLERWKEK